MAGVMQNLVTSRLGRLGGYPFTYPTSKSISQSLPTSTSFLSSVCFSIATKAH